MPGEGYRQVLHLAQTHLVKLLFHQLSAAPALHQGRLGWNGGHCKAHDSLVGAVAQKPHQGVGLLGLYRLEAGKGGDVAGFGPKAQEVSAVFVVNQLLLCDLLHLFSKTLSGGGIKRVLSAQDNPDIQDPHWGQGKVQPFSPTHSVPT